MILSQVAGPTIGVDRVSPQHPLDPRIPSGTLGICHIAFSSFPSHILTVSRGYCERPPVATMGRSSPPFLYDRPSTYTFQGPTERGFNPRAVTQASQTPASPKAQPKGPLITFNRHPDTVYALLHVNHASTNGRRSGVILTRKSQHVRR